MRHLEMCKNAFPDMLPREKDANFLIRDTILSISYLYGTSCIRVTRVSAE